MTPHKFYSFFVIGVFALLAASCSENGGVEEGDDSSRSTDPNDSDPESGCECDIGVFEQCEAKGVLGLRKCEENCQWSACSSASDSDTDTDTEEVFLPPEEHCPDGYLELNIKDFFTASATPHLINKGGVEDGPLPFATQPNTIRVMTEVQQTNVFGAKPHPSNCDFYRTCIPKGTQEIFIQPIDPTKECGNGELLSGAIDIGSMTDADFLTISHEGNIEEVTYDFFSAGWEGATHRFSLSNERPEAVVELDPLQAAPSCTDQSKYKILHFRWPWGDPEETGFAGTGCEHLENINTGGEIGSRQYPPSVSVYLDSCEAAVATLERNDGFCPWYKVLIPENDWNSANTIRFLFVTSNSENDTDESVSYDLLLNDMVLPDSAANEFWLVYEGPTDDSTQGTPCKNFSYRPEMYHFYTANLGPAYPGCGGEAPPEDCAEVKPLGSSMVHFRYLWAGQKTFTYFPKDEFMPPAIFLHVNSKEYPCVQEGDSPWFRCPIPNEEFFEGATWRAVDKSHDEEWNLVEPEPTFPTSPGTYWIRWWDGKPDIPAESEYAITTYYPDGVEWAKAGSWGDDFCFSEDRVDRPAIRSDGFFPWDETNYAYDNGQSIAKWYDNERSIQNLMNYFVWERYQLWKEKYVRYDDDACGDGTARVDSSDFIGIPTVSEGQGYGMAIAGAIGDKELFGKLWRFVNHYLGQSADKYCGGLMGWSWPGPEACQEYGENSSSSEGADDLSSVDSAFDGDVDIAIGLVYAAWQWPEYTQDAVDWILKMECEINRNYDGQWYYPANGDTWNKNCANYPDEPCDYMEGVPSDVNMSYFPPGYFRVFGEFLLANMNPAQYTPAERRNHLDFWYRTAETVWEMTERCYDQDGMHPALLEDFGTVDTPCSRATDNFNWSRGLWRLAIDAAWYGTDDRFYSFQDDSSRHYDGKSQAQAKMDLIQNYYSQEFPVQNPGEEFANRFSTICQQLTPAGDVAGCDPAYSHNSYFVSTAMSSFATFYDNDGLTTPAIRREALEESVSVAIQDALYFQESIGVYVMLFMTGNFPRPYSKAGISVVAE